MHALLKADFFLSVRVNMMKKKYFFQTILYANHFVVFVVFRKLKANSLMYKRLCVAFLFMFFIWVIDASICNAFHTNDTKQQQIERFFYPFIAYNWRKKIIKWSKQQQKKSTHQKKNLSWTIFMYKKAWKEQPITKDCDAY